MLCYTAVVQVHCRSSQNTEWIISAYTSALRVNLEIFGSCPEFLFWACTRWQKFKNGKLSLAALAPGPWHARYTILGTQSWHRTLGKTSWRNTWHTTLDMAHITLNIYLLYTTGNNFLTQAVFKLNKSYSGTASPHYRRTTRQTPFALESNPCAKWFSFLSRPPCAPLDSQVPRWPGVSAIWQPTSLTLQWPDSHSKLITTSFILSCVLPCLGIFHVESVDFTILIWFSIWKRGTETVISPMFDS